MRLILFPPKDRRVFKRPWLALPCGCLVLMCAAPILLWMEAFEAFTESDTWERIRAYVFDPEE